MDINFTLCVIFMGWVKDLAGYIGDTLTGVLNSVLRPLFDILMSLLDPIIDKTFGTLVSIILDVDALIYYAGQSSFSAVLDYNDLDNALYSKMFTMAESVFNVLGIVGTGLCILYFFMSLMDKLSKDRLTSTTLLRSGVELTFAVMMICFSFSALKSVANIAEEATFGGKTIGQIIDGTTVDDSEGSDVPYVAFTLGTTREVAEEHPFLSLGPVLFSLGPALLYWIAATLCAAICTTVVISRAIQTAIYLAYAPIPIANTFNRGSIMESSAVSYLKKLAALSLQGPIVVFVMKAYNLLISNIDINSQGTYSVLPLLIAITLVTASLVFKSGQFANDIIN